MSRLPGILEKIRHSVLWGLAFTTVIFLSGCDESINIKIDATKHHLKNGITVIAVEDHSVPVLTYQSWFRVGSINERPGITGISHLFEHMMFKGAKRYGDKEFDQVLEKNGGQSNAFTTQDLTAYYENIRSDQLELVIDLESDRLESLALTEENLKSEREVVKEERRYRVDNSPVGRLREALWKLSMPKDHPYRWPVIGWPEDLNAITLKDCKDYFKKFYNPANLTIVIVGDFKTKEALEWIEKYYGEIPSEKVKSEIPDAPAPLNEPLRQELTGGTQLSWLAMGFRVPKIGTKEALVGDLVDIMLSDGESSFFQKSLIIKKQLALMVSSGIQSGIGGGLFTVFAQLRPGVPFEALEEEIWAILKKIEKEGVDETVLRKIKNKLLIQTLSQLKTNYGIGQLVGWNEVQVGDYKKIHEDFDIYMSITSEDIQKFLKLLEPNKSAVIKLKP